MAKKEVVFIQDPESGIIYKQGDPESFLTALYSRITGLEKRLEDLEEKLSNELSITRREIGDLARAILNWEDFGRGVKHGKRKD